VLDVVVIGAGIVGLATARALTDAGLDVAVVEKEDRVAAHQSGRNSNVLHSGIYYAPGSLKATTVAEGRATMQTFCAEHDIATDVCGKVIVATEPDEIPRLDALAERGVANGIAVERLGPDGLRDVEPHAAGVAALRVPSAAIVDFAAVCRTLARLVGDVRLSTAVVALRERGDRVVVETTAGEIVAGAVVNCAGLHCDRIAALHAAVDVRIVPFRGEYHELVPSRRHLVRTLIYPVPDPGFPFLGVHLTRGLDGAVHCGPNAVLATAREGYRRRDVRLADVRETVTFAGFRSLARRHWRTGASEVARSLSRRRFARSLQRLVPEVDARDLVPAPAGVRAQAVGADGALLDDFVIRRSSRIVDVLNAPSPAATAALAIGRVVSDAVR
jgi:L-2-hydroxyglutarate oxidase